MPYYTRDQWGARPPRGGPGGLTPSRVEGIALHWPAMSSPLRGFKVVTNALRGWQNYHMDDKGWSDIGYQIAVDQDGNRYELRGLATQSGANGDTDVNERFGAALLILAPGEEPTDAMVAAVRTVVANHRDLFPHSRRIVGHADIRPEPTACPGPAALAAIRAGTFDPEENDDMPNYTDWSDKDRAALTRDVSRAVLREKVKILSAKGEPIEVTVKQAIARTANMSRRTEDNTDEILDKLNAEGGDSAPRA